MANSGDRSESATQRVPDSQSIHMSMAAGKIMEVRDLGMDSIGPRASDRNAGSGAQVQEHKSGTVMGLMVDRWGVHPHGVPVPPLGRGLSGP